MMSPRRASGSHGQRFFDRGPLPAASPWSFAKRLTAGACSVPGRGFSRADVPGKRENFLGGVFGPTKVGP